MVNRKITIQSGNQERSFLLPSDGHPAEPSDEYLKARDIFIATVDAHHVPHMDVEDIILICLPAGPSGYYITRTSRGSYCTGMTADICIEELSRPEDMTASQWILETVTHPNLRGIACMVVSAKEKKAA